MHTSSFDWVEHYPAAVSVCDTEGTIVAMNRLSREMFAKSGGVALIGTSLFACHGEAANAIIRRLLAEQTGNTYITEKKGQRKFVHQTPWYNQGKFAGLVETVFPIPTDIPVKKRD